MSLSKSVQFGQLYTVNCATETQWVQWWKAALNPLVSIWSVSFEFSFCGGNTRFTYVFAVSTSKLSQLQNKKNWIYLQYLSLPFTYWTEVNLRTFINRRWEWIILSVRSLTVMEKDTVAKLVPLFFQKCSCAFFFLSTLLLTRIRLLQILVKVMFQSLFGSLLSHLYHYANENLSVKLLSLILLTSILTNIYSLKNCSVYGRSCCNYSPKSFGFFWKEFRQI